MPTERTEARIGDLTFDTRYADPVVDVDTESNTVEKTTINDEIVVQRLGRRADRITVQGIVLEDQLYELDQLVDSGEVTVRTQRWAGRAIALETSSNYTQAYDIVYVDDATSNEWLYEVRIDLIEVFEIPSDATSPGSGDTGAGGQLQSL